MPQQEPIRIRGARQNNLRNLDLDIYPGELTVVTGPSGSGKSSLVFDTLFAEGQRRYVETFSPYARQFLDRMDKPAVDHVLGVPPAIAIDQTNPVRNSRSTVGTMTELNDHLKLFFARAAHLHDRNTALPVQHDTAQSIHDSLLQRCAQVQDPRIALTFALPLPTDTTPEEATQWLSASGFTKIQAQTTTSANIQVLDVVTDRFRCSRVSRARMMEAIETALQQGNGHLTVHVMPDEGEPYTWKFSLGLHCPDSGLCYTTPTPALFSFNAALGACDSCRGFGRIIGVDWDLVIPNDKLTLRTGAIKPIQTPAWQEIQEDLMRHAQAQGIACDTAWNKLSAEHRHWVIEGASDWNGQWSQSWYGIRRFFTYLESKTYKMHIRVLLSKYRSYTPCPTCAGARLKTESLLWRIGTCDQANAVLPAIARFMPTGVAWNYEQLQTLPGLCLHDCMRLPIERLRHFFQLIEAAQFAHTNTPIHSSGEQQALKLLHEEIHTRLQYLCDVGLGYLTLDRQSRTLSGGEVQRINLTTALGTSLVNTLFVLDEPSIGLHPRDMTRITRAMQRLRDAGNTLVVVEHDPAIMFAADRIIDMGPGPGEQGGQIVFDGRPDALRQAHTLTGAYLGGRKKISQGQRRTIMPNMAYLRLEGVHAHNLRNLDVTFPLQCLVTITGVSGSGKSTLLHSLAAISSIDKGEIIFDGKRIDKLSDNQRSILRRTGFGFVFQFGQLVPELTVLDNVALPLLLNGIKRGPAYSSANTWIDKVGLNGKENSLPGELSGGQAQRVAIARAMIIEPRILFADEPTGSLDSLNSERVMELFINTAKKHGTTVIMVTHEPSIAAYADREIVVRDGQISGAK